MSLCSVTLAGRLGQKPEGKDLANDNYVCNFSVAVDRYVGKGKPKETDWHNLTAFGPTAKAITQYCDKGSEVTVLGSLRNRSYDNKEGVKVKVTEIVVDKVDFHGSKLDADQGTSDIPF